MKKTKLEAQKTREQLLDAALEIFWRNGVSNTPLQAIANEAGLTRGALYWHFKNKEDLFDALFEQNFSPFIEQLEQIPQQSGNALENVRARFYALFQLLENNEQQRKFCSIMRLKCEHNTRNAMITDLVRQYHHRSFSQISQILTYCRDQKTLPEKVNIPLASIYLKSSINGLIDIWILDPNVLSLSRLGKVIVDTALDNITNHPSFLLPE